MKKMKLVEEICRAVRVERKNPTYRNLSFRELVAVASWLRITNDVVAEVEQRMAAQFTGEQKNERDD